MRDGGGGSSPSAGAIGAAAGVAAGGSRPRASSSGGGGGGLSRPSSTPTYQAGGIRSVRSTQSSAAAAAAQYRSRLNAYNTARSSFLKGLGKVNTQANQQYQAGVKGATGAYGKGASGLGKNFGMTKKQLAQQRLGDIEGLGNDYANRGVSRTSGIYQQAMKDYETGYGSRVKGASDSYNTALKGLAGQRDKSLSSAAARRSAALAASKAKLSAYDKAHPKPGK